MRDSSSKKPRPRSRTFKGEAEPKQAAAKQKKSAARAKPRASAGSKSSTTKKAGEGDGGSRLKAALLAVAGLVGVLGAVALVIVVHYHVYTTSPIPALEEQPKMVVIEDGSSFASATSQLEAAGLITRPLYFRILARRTGADRVIRAGTYRLDPGLSPQSLLEQLKRGGEDEQVRLVVPEGYNIFLLGDRLEALGLANRDAFLAHVHDPEVLSRFGLTEGDSLEGYLFPDTYFFKQGTSIETIVTRMVRRFEQVWDELEEEVGENQVASVKTLHEMNTHKLVTLASIVEREAIVRSEGPIIARVFYNRLAIDMKLQTDPTCVYGPNTYKDKPHPRNCRDKSSRYSTYVNKGLPPGPIGNPGRASLEAVLTPTRRVKERDYLYFVARRDGSNRHSFSRTYKGHLKGVERLKAKSRRRARSRSRGE